MDAEGAGGISSAKDRGHSQVRGQTASSGISQGALLGHLRGQVGAYSSRVGVDEDADPDHRAGLEMKRMNDSDQSDAVFSARVASTSTDQKKNSLILYVIMSSHYLCLHSYNALFNHLVIQICHNLSFTNCHKNNIWYPAHVGHHISHIRAFIYL